jgi:hypothetical protein
MIQKSCVSLSLASSASNVQAHRVTIVRRVDSRAHRLKRANLNSERATA